MHDGAYSLEELKVKLDPVFGQYGVRNAILFGSYAKGLTNDHRDVDILVDSGFNLP